MAKYNTVPLGRAGTGAAYILGESQAANQLLDQIDYNRQIAAQNEALKRQYAQQMANDWRQNQLKIKGGTLWEGDLQSAASEVMDLGTKLRQAGFNPYQPNPNDPIQMQASELFLTKKRQVEDMADYRDKVQATLAEQHKLNDEKFGYFDPKTVESLNNFPSAYTLKDAYNQGIQAPTLRKAFNIHDDVLKNIEGVSKETEFTKGNLRTRTKVADIDKHNRIADQTLATNNYLISDFKRRTGYEPVEVAGLGNTREAIAQDLDKEYRGDPNKVAELAQMGIQSFDSPQYKALIEGKSNELLNVKQQYNKVRKTITDKLDADVDTYYKTDPDYTNSREYRARRAEARSNQKATEPTWIQDLYNRVLDQKEGAGEELFDEIKGGLLNKGGQTFIGKPVIHKVQDKNGNVTSISYRLPPVESGEDADGNKRIVQGEREFTFNPNNREEATRVLNNMRNAYVTSDRQPLSKVFTPGGKGKVPGGQSEKGLKQQRQKPTLSQADRDALNWANRNPKDPRSKAIKDSLKAKGLL